HHRRDYWRLHRGLAVATPWHCNRRWLYCCDHQFFDRRDHPVSRSATNQARCLEPGRQSAAKLLVARRGFETFGKFASSSLSVAITAFDLFLQVFKYSLTDAPRKPRRPQNPTDVAGFQTGTLNAGPKNVECR